MSTPTYYVIGGANSDAPWPLSLSGYATPALAQRAINWQAVGQGAFDPPGYWQIAIIDPALGRCHSLDGNRTFDLSPGGWTDAAWADFCQRTGYRADPRSN
jgi:hypothetical protein